MAKKKQNQIRDIAEASGVSTATVSRVFNRHPYVSSEIRERVLKITKEMNYAPKITSTGSLFALLLSGYNAVHIGPYEAQLIHAITKKLFEKNYNIQIISEHYLPYLHKNSFKGIIALTPFAAKCIEELNILPSITINQPVSGVHSVATDHKGGIEMAVDYLVGKGHKKIAYIMKDTTNWGSVERGEAYKESLLKHNLLFDETIVRKFKASSKNDIIELVGHIMRNSPTALILEGEGFGLVLNYAMYVLNKKVPDDISVIAFEDNLTSQYMTPPLTTVSQDLEALGAIAAEEIIEISRNPTKYKEPLNIILPNKIIERMSVKDIR